MDGRAWKSQLYGRGQGRGRPFKHHPPTSPMPPPVVVGDEHSVNVSVNVSNSGSIKWMMPTGTGACSGSAMDGSAWQSQPCGRGQGRSFKHHPPTSTPSPVVVGEEHFVNVSVKVSNSGSIENGRDTWPQKSHDIHRSKNDYGSIKNGMDIWPRKSHEHRSKNDYGSIKNGRDTWLQKSHDIHRSENDCGSIKNGRDIWPQKSHDIHRSENDYAGTLHHHMANKLNICDNEDVSISETSTHTHPVKTEPFDIFRDIALKPSLLVNIKARKMAMERSSNSGVVLRPGMVLLKSYISLSDQVKIVKICRELGMGPGGFYQPSYRDGTKLNLNMMCLGKNWDPQTFQYRHRRPYDGAHPPHIPLEFHQLVHAAIRDSHSLIQQHIKTPNSNPQHQLPFISPDICIVNFYSPFGLLGLHQDKDESEESIRAGIPVVSFSIGDSADFFYGDERDIDTAKKILLESGDVLIFGGKSRNIFHGITNVHPNTTPRLLLQETNLRQGRLNLTFRQY